MIELEELINAAPLVIDKSNWFATRFGEVAIQQKVSVDRENTELTKYVKGEHMSSEDIHLREWGDLQDEYLGPAFIRYFEEGDILYGSRRTYLKKVTVAPFEGITSNTTFVIKPNENKIDKRLLPYLMLSDRFTDHSVENSKGSVNPYINWKDIANYEFLLPPKDQQAQLAELLWAMDEVIERDLYLESLITTVENSVFDSFIYEDSDYLDPVFGRKKSKFQVEKLGALISDLQYGISEALNDKGELPVLRMNNLQNGKLDLEALKYYSPPDGAIDRFILDKGDILFNRTNSYDLVGKVSLFNEVGKFSFASYLIRIKAKRGKLNSSFLNFYLNSPIGLAKIRKYRTPGVSQSNINAQNLKNVPIPLPEIDQQNNIMQQIHALSNNKEIVSIRKSQSQSLQKSLINHIF